MHFNSSSLFGIYRVSLKSDSGAADRNEKAEVPIDRELKSACD